MTVQHNDGVGLSGIGGILVLISFAVLPLVTIVWFMQWTALQVAEQAGGLWLLALAATGAVGVATWQLFARSSPSGPRGIILLLLGLLFVLGLILVYIALRMQVLSWFNNTAMLGPGFWGMLVGALTMAVGGFIELRSGFSEARDKPVALYSAAQP
jgi:hypothetical protein